MSQYSFSKKLLGGLMLALLLAACKSTPMVDKPAAVDEKSPGVTAPAKTPSTADANAIKELNVDGTVTNGDSALRDPNSILSKRTVYFDYDSDAVKEEYRPLLEAHAKYLATHSAAKVVLQGYTDERGTREYNLSLGQRRAVSVKKSLNVLGVQDAQIETVSYGEEKAGTCTTDTCNQEARRVDIVYVGE